MSQPTVSVIIPSYNHAKVVGEAIQSVLAQTVSDFELLVEDDGSTDGSADVLRGLSDSRLNLVLNERNSGAGIVTNRLVQRSRGRYIALINSDDVWLPGKLQHQADWLDHNIDVAAVFSRASFIDEAGQPIDPDKLPFGHVFDMDNRSQGAWLRHFLYDGNCLCNPSMMVRREALVRTGPFDNRLRQLPDFDMWVRMARREVFHVDTRAFVKFRIWSNDANASSVSPENSARAIMEHMVIAESFFDGLAPDVLRQGFSDLLRHPDFSTPIHQEIEQALLYFARPECGYSRTLKIVGYRKLHHLLGRPDARVVLLRDYGISDRFFHDLGMVGSMFLPPQVEPQDAGGRKSRNRRRRVGMLP